jgi:hypothetical protein
MATATNRGSGNRRIVNKSDLLILLPQGRKKSPVVVRVSLERGTIALRTLGKQMPSLWKVLGVIFLSAVACS